MFRNQDDAAYLEATNQHGETRHLWYYYDEPDGPQGYLVGMPAHNVVKPHFHRAAQFQVFFGAAGATYLRSELTPGSVVVHYADAFTTYGPIETADESLRFFTLRAENDPFTGYMPADRNKLERRGGRNLHGKMTPQTSGGDAVAIDYLIPPETDGLLACALYLPPGAEAVAPDLGSGSGQYLCVTEGSLIDDGRICPATALLWNPPDAAPAQVQAGGDGASILLMQLPATR